ncbi:hypothetical protein Goshw_004598, partial [Gossypium schwendimanii]|nr:hypothetical protein [Gossypium schwendimanii]
TSQVIIDPDRTGSGCRKGVTPAIKYRENKEKYLKIYGCRKGSLALLIELTNLELTDLLKLATSNTLLPQQLLTKSKKLISRLGNGSNAAGYFSFFFDNDNVLRLKYYGSDTLSLYWPNVDKHWLWKITWEVVLELRKVHGICGRNGICVNTPNLPKCSCLPGYEMADPSNWKKCYKPRFNKTCSRSQQLKTFIEILYVDFYGYDIDHYINKTLDLGKNACMNDSSCERLDYNKIKGERKCLLKAALFNGDKSPNV